MANESLGKAKSRKNDEFYTVYDYIQKEMNAYLEYDPNVFRGKTILLPCDDPEWSNFTKYFAQNFETLGIKKLISTSYATDRKKQQYEQYHQMTLFELNFPQYDEEKSHSHGKIFTLTRDINKSGVIDIDDLEWQYLEGDGDFRSDEVCALRDEADIIVTNPPFSLFREFVAWVMEAEKKIVVIGNQNAITYKEIFPLLKENKLWIGATNNGQDMVFEVPEGAIVAPKDKEKAEKLGYKGNYTRLGNACWFTNIDHGRRHQPLSLMTMADNLKYSKHKQIREQGYLKYDNYDAIEVPFVDAIPSDYVEDMGVPITDLQPDGFTDDRKECKTTFAGTHEEIVEKYLTLLDYAQDDFMGLTYDDGNKAFANGDAVMIINGNWAINQYKNANADINVNMFALPASNDESKNYVTSGVDVLMGVCKDSANEDMAKEFVSFMMEPENAQTYIDDQFAFSAIKDVEQNNETVAGVKEDIANGKVANFPDHYYPSGFDLSALISEMCLNYSNGMDNQENMDQFLKQCDEKYDIANVD